MWGSQKDGFPCNATVNVKNAMKRAHEMAVVLMQQQQKQQSLPKSSPSFLLAQEHLLSKCLAWSCNINVPPQENAASGSCLPEALFQELRQLEQVAAEIEAAVATSNAPKGAGWAQLLALRACWEEALCVHERFELWRSSSSSRKVAAGEGDAKGGSSNKRNKNQGSKAAWKRGTGAKAAAAGQSAVPGAAPGDTQKEQKQQKQQQELELLEQQHMAAVAVQPLLRYWKLLWGKVQVVVSVLEGMTTKEMLPVQANSRLIMDALLVYHACEMDVGNGSKVRMCS